MSILEEDYQFIVKLIKDKIGNELANDRQYLVQSRLEAVLKRFEFKDYSALVQALKSNPFNQELICAVTDAMTINESLFFRDKTPFQILTSEIFPKLIEARKSNKLIRVWSAACSTGQEPYSIAMTYLSHPGNKFDVKLEVDASDVCKTVLERASAGIYSDFEVQRGVQSEELRMYFSRLGNEWQVSSSVKSLTRFSRINLLDVSPFAGPYDIIFCRNVLIYFDKELKTKVLNSIARVLAPDGYLILGGAESPIGFTQQFENASESSSFVYRLNTNQKINKVV